MTQVVLTATDDTGTSAQLTLSIAAPAVPAARFSRVTYDNSNLPPIKGRYAMIDMQAGTPSLATTKIAAIRRTDPGCTVLTYAAVDGLDPNSTDGVTRPAANGSYPASSYLRDSSGAVLMVGGYQRMDIADPAWQTIAAQYCVNQCQTVGSQGIFLDGVSTSKFWQGLPAGLAGGSAETDQTWQAAWTSMLTVLARTLAAKGLVLVANIGGGAMYGGGGGPLIWQRYLSTGIAGAMEESWAYGEDGKPVSGDKGKQWIQALQNVAWAESHGKTTILTGNYAATPQEATFALGSMLLVAGGLATFCVSGTRYFGTEAWLSQYDQAVGLGAPRQGPVTTPLPSGLFVRAFTGGHVLVNPTASAITDPAFGTVSAYSAVV